MSHCKGSVICRLPTNSLGKTIEMLFIPGGGGNSPPPFVLFYARQNWRALYERRARPLRASIRRFCVQAVKQSNKKKSVSGAFYRQIKAYCGSRWTTQQSKHNRHYAITWKRWAGTALTYCSYMAPCSALKVLLSNRLVVYRVHLIL